MPREFYKSAANPEVSIPGLIDAEVWIGWHQEWGWVLLDYSRFNNYQAQTVVREPNQVELSDPPRSLRPTDLVFELLDSHELVVLDRTDWEAPTVTWYRTRLHASETEEQQRSLDALVVAWAARDQERRAKCDQIRRARAALLVCEESQIAVRRALATMYSRMVRNPPRPARCDYELAALWAQSDDDYVMNKMLSARIAERAALDIYAEYFGATADVSIGQLAGADASQWQVADIASGTRLIDVKNARRSLGCAREGVGGYSEHCVPRFKHGRSSHDVVISGFLSEYGRFWKDGLPLQPWQVDPGEEVVWLGEITQSAVAALRDEFETESLKLDMSRVHASGQFIPPWMFDYPPEVYEPVDQALAALRSAASDSQLWDPQGAVRLLSIGDGGKSEVATQLAERFCGSPRIHRARLFLHILSCFVDSIVAHREFPGHELREAIMCSTEELAKTDTWRHSECVTPLSICDPLHTIESLLTVLSSVADACRNDLRAYTQFKLAGPNILQARTGAGRWNTVIAYCGGRDVKTNAPCGLNPLYLGRDQVCEACGRLICRQCRFCLKNCLECAKRRVAPG